MDLRNGVRCAVLLSALLLLPAGELVAQATGVRDAGLAAKVDALFAEWDRPGSPGCAVGIVRNGELIYQRGYGMANLDYDLPITRESVFYVGSVSKQFAAAAIAHLAHTGKVSLDDDVRTYIPELPEYERPITVRHLVHHTSGLRDIYSLMSLAGIRMEDVFPEDDAIALIARQQGLNFAPGEEYMYSNSGYFLLSVLVERAAGLSLREYADRHIFQPLGMHDTHFHDAPAEVIRNRVISYQPDGDGGFRISYLGNFDKVGAGGLYTTIEDLARWDQHFYDHSLAGPEFTELLLTRGTLNSGEALGYAFGIQHGEYRGLRTIGHGGSLMGFRADFTQFPDERFSVLTACNLGSINPGGIARQIADLYLAHRLHPEQEREAVQGSAAAARQRTAPPAPARLAEYVGEYRSAEVGSTFALSLEDGALRLRRPNAAPAALVPSGTDAFRAGSWTLQFVRDGDGRVTGFTVDAGRARGVVFDRR